MAFFNEPQQEEVEKNDNNVDQRRLALLRSFEARLWEMNVQVQGISCIAFGQEGHTSIPSELIQRCSRVGVSVVRESADGFRPLSLWPPSLPLLLAEEVEPQRFRLSTVTNGSAGAGGCGQVRELVYLAPLSIQDFYTLVEFMLSYHQWCA